MSQQLLQHLERFISFRSTVDQPEEKENCLHWIQETFFPEETNKITRGAVDGSPYLYLKNPNSKILWFAHIDVVPALEHQFSVIVKNDHAYGRGVKDMKGATLTMLMAYKQAREQGIDAPVSILLTSDEEVAGPTIPNLLQKKLITADVAYTPDSGTDSGIIYEHKGVVWAKLSVHGKGTHSALPWTGQNPIPRLAEVLLHLQKQFPEGAHSDWQMTVTPTGLQGSKANNQVPDVASAVLDIRFPPSVCSTPEEALDLVRAELPDDTELHTIVGASPLQTSADHPMILMLQDIAQHTLTKDVPVEREHGATDARFFGEVGIPAFIWGPDGGGIHGKEEWVSVSSLQKHVEMYEQWIEKLSQL